MTGARSWWLWWWDLPGRYWWFPYRFLGRDVMWSVNAGGPAAWPGRVRCLRKPHVNDSYGNCCYCGAWLAAHPGDTP
jgi:hypothetical protein